MSELSWQITADMNYFSVLYCNSSTMAVEHACKVRLRDMAMQSQPSLAGLGHSHGCLHSMYKINETYNYCYNYIATAANVMSTTTSTMDESGITSMILLLLQDSTKLMKLLIIVTISHSCQCYEHNYQYYG